MRVRVNIKGVLDRGEKQHFLNGLRKFIINEKGPCHNKKGTSQI